MSRTVAYTSIAFAAICLAGYVFWLFFRDDVTLCQADPEVCPCLALIPDFRAFGISFETDKSGKLRKVTFGGDQQRKRDPSQELAEQFVQCLQGMRNDIEILNYSRLSASPLGQIANIWNRSGGMSIKLRPPDSEIIQNIQIGPDSGLRWDIMKDFCAAANACVACEPTDPGGDEVSVLVSLKPNPPARREKVGTGFVNPRNPWELVDENGDRYHYICNE